MEACAFSPFFFLARLACGWSFVGRGLYCVSWPSLWVILFLPYFFVLLILLPLKVAICQSLVGSLLWVLNRVESDTFRIVGSHPFGGVNIFYYILTYLPPKKGGSTTFGLFPLGLSQTQHKRGGKGGREGSVNY